KALATKSLLEKATNDRWRLHEVVRQWAWVQPDRSTGKAMTRQELLLKRRDAYFMGWLRDVHGRLAGPEEPQALARIDMESANLREAWQSAARHANLAQLEAAAPAWFDYLECRSFITEGIDAADIWLATALRDTTRDATAAPLYYLGLFQRFGARTAEALNTMDAALSAVPADAERLTAQVQAAKAFLLLLLGQLGEAKKSADAALVVAEKTKDAALQASACRVLGLALMQSGGREEGRELQRRALDLARSVGRPSLVAAAHNNLALAENHLGNYASAEAGYENALAFWREIQATANIGRGMHNLGVVATRQGRHEEALTRYRAALAMLRKAGDRNLIALNLMSTGDALLRLNRAGEAHETAEQALDMAERDGHMLPALDARIVMAQADIVLEKFGEAARQLRIVLDAAARHGFSNVLADAVVSSARLLAKVDPASHPDAQRWARSIGAMVDVSLTIRRDADLLAAEIGDDRTGSTAPGKAPVPAKKPARLADLAKQADGRLAKLKLVQK
ncbi:MAG: tetratricopeptide repeat protein, partial [Betaproteobacteria bacterium]